MMVANGVFIKSLKIILMVVFYSLSIFLSSCSQVPQLPEGAQETLDAYWQSLPSAPGIRHHIIRAWSGATSSEELTSRVTSMEIWCVEAEITSSEDLDLDGERLIWIVFRENEKANWSASMLATMSSTWPYEVCHGRRLN
jgi:hypothetical protein